MADSCPTECFNETKMAMNHQRNFMQDLMQIPQEQTTEFMLGLAQYMDRWRSAGLEYPHLLFLTIALFSKAFSKVPKETLLKAIGAAIDMQRLIDENPVSFTMAANEAVKQEAEQTNPFKKIIDKWRNG